MLLHLFFSKKYNTKIKQVDSNGHAVVVFNFLPGLLHFVGPINIIKNKNRIIETLNHYKIEIAKIKATIGPTVTLYEIVPAPGVRISKIKSL